MTKDNTTYLYKVWIETENSYEFIKQIKNGDNKFYSELSWFVLEGIWISMNKMWEVGYEDRRKEER